MSESGSDSSPRARRTRPALGYGLLVLGSLLLGTVGVLPFVSALYAADQLVLAPLGLTPADPTNDDGVAPVVIAGVVAPAVVISIWAGLVVVLLRRYAIRRRWAWLPAAACLLLPVAVFVTERTI